MILNNVFKKKSISSLIATILLIVVSVAIITIVLSWTKGFTHDSLDLTSSLPLYTESDVSFFVRVENSMNGRSVLSYFPPENPSYKDLNIVGYALLGYTNHVVPLEPPVSLLKNQKVNVDHGIILPSLDLILYLDNGTMITKKGISQTIKQPTSCPEGYIPVPGNHLYGTMNERGGFCVMKWEAKVDQNGDGVGDTNTSCELSTVKMWDNRISGCSVDNLNRYLVSTKEGWPVYGFNLNSGKLACEGIGSHLITNNEWMTIVRNIELVPENWTSNQIGVGEIYRGHCSNVLSYILEASDDDDGYFGTDQTINQKRTLKLTNGEIVWDLSGNMIALVDFETEITRVGQVDVINVLTNEILVSGTWINFTGVENNLTISSLGQFKYKDLFLLNQNIMHSDYGVGMLYTLSGYTSNGILYSLRRGWGIEQYSQTGIVGLGINQPATQNMSGIRCSFMP